MEIIKKYKWYIIWCCCTSFPIYLEIEDDCYDGDGYKTLYLIGFIALFAFFNVALPLLMYIIVQYFKQKKEFKKPRKKYQCIRFSDVSPTENSYTLEDFSNLFGDMFICTASTINHTVELDKCAFRRSFKDDIIISVDKNIKHYTKDMIIKEKENLEVVLQESGDYCLCRKWEAVNF